MDYASQVQMLFRATTRPSAAPFVCLALMVALRHQKRSWEVDELMTGTGIRDRESIAEARRVLPTLGLARLGPGGRTLMLTDEAVRQLSFVDDLVRLAGDVVDAELVTESRIGKTDPSSGSSSFSLEESSSVKTLSDLQLLLLPQDGSEKPIREAPSCPREEHLEEETIPHARPLVELLVENGVDTATATAAVQAALNECGRSPEYAEWCILDCLLYADSPKGQTINADGYYAARKIEKDEQAPYYSPSPNHGKYQAEWRMWQSRNERYIQRRDELARKMQGENP